MTQPLNQTAQTAPTAPTEQDLLAPLNRNLNAMHERGAQSLIFESQQYLATSMNGQSMRLENLTPLSYPAVERLLRASADKDSIRILFDKG